MKKTIAILLALIMVMSFATTAFAASITVNGEAGETYEAYKIFNVTYANLDDADASNDVYTYTIKDDSEWYSVVNTYAADSANGLTLKESTTEAGVTTYVVTTGTGFSASKFAETLYANVAGKSYAGTGTIADGASATTIPVADAGYYFVTTSLGTLCILNTADDTVTVNEKNEVPTVDKKITGASDIDDAGKNAIEQVGSTVTYTATITVEDNSINYVYHDTMDTTLAFDGVDSIQVTVGGAPVDPANYTIAAPGANGETFTVSFNNDYITGLAADTVISITYTAKVTSDALILDPANNTAYLTYGDKGQTNKITTAVYNATITVNKEDGNGQPLAGAGFVLKNEAGKYYKFTAASGSTPATVSWVDNIADATEYVSDNAGNVTPFSGLTSGKYTLIEKTVPDGYNKADDVNFEIKEDDYTAENLSQETTVVNKSGTELPSTGGMGTTLFYVFGSMMVVGAAVVLVTKKRMGAAE